MSSESGSGFDKHVSKGWNERNKIMDIYSYINSPDVADYCREIGKTWNPFEMAVIIGRSAHSLMADRHQAWQELITDYPDMPTPATSEYPSFNSLHKKLSEVIDYENRAFELFIKPEDDAFYISKIHDGSPWDRYDPFSDYESAKAALDAKSFNSWMHKETDRITIEKFYIGSKQSHYCTCDFDGNIRRLCFDYADERFPDINISELLDLSPGFNNEESFYVDIPIPFKRGDILQVREYSLQPGKPFVLGTLPDREKLFAQHHSESPNYNHSIYGWVYDVNDIGILAGDVAYDSDCFEYFNGELVNEQKLLRYLSLYFKGELDIAALLALQCRYVLKKDIYLDGYEYQIPYDIVDEEYQRVSLKRSEPIKLFSGIFWLITEDSELSDYQLLMFGIPCDGRGGLTETPEVQPNSRSGKSYNHKTTWEMEVAGKQAHEPYSGKPYDYYPRGRVEISNRCAVIFLNPCINQPTITEEIKLKFGLGSHEISKIRIVEDGSFHNQCFLNGGVT